jgi:hypothetical protein
MHEAIEEKVQMLRTVQGRDGSGLATRLRPHDADSFPRPCLRAIIPLSRAAILQPKQN